MTRKDLVAGISEATGINVKESGDILDQILEYVKNTLNDGEEIKISGFGTFSVRKKSARIGRNPKTKEEVEISSRRVVTFKPSDQLRAVVNGGGLIDESH